MDTCPAGACPFKDQCDQRTARAAVRYAELGYAVYPASPYSQAHVSSLGQFEKGQGGFKIASTDMKQILEWMPQWSAPTTNIGIATGQRSMLVVIDIDARPLPVDTSSGSVTFSDTVAIDPEPAERVRKWAADRGLMIPGDAIVATPSGGTHIWLRIPEHWRGYEVPRRLRWLEAVDLLWDKHSIKAPPSNKLATERKPGGEYRFTVGCPCEVPVMDDEFIRALHDTPALSKLERGDDDWTTGGVDVDGMRASGIPIGEQNQRLYEMACSFAAKGRLPGDAVAELWATISASPVGEPDWPWTLDDIKDIVGRAYHFIAENRGGYSALAAKIRM